MDTILQIGSFVREDGELITDFETWMLDVGFDRTFRMLEYRRVGDWTPLEMEKKWIDQSHYKDNQYVLIRIKEAIELPDGDILLGYIDVTNAEYLEDFDPDKECVYYKKLSQIEINWFPEDDEIKDE